MLLTESQIRQIIKEEIDAMIEEGQIDEAFADTLRRGVGKLGAKLASAAGTTSADVADVEKAKASEKEKSQFMAGVSSGTKRAKEVEGLVNQAVKSLINVDKTLESLTEFSQDQQKIQALHSSLNAFHKQLDEFKKSVLGYKFESKDK